MTPVLFDECVNRRYALPALTPLADVQHSRDWLPRAAADEEVLDLARRLDRVLITEDVGFGRLIFAEGLAPPRGIVLLAISAMPKAERVPRLSDVAEEALLRSQGAFVTVTPTQVRSRAFPTP